VKITQIIKKRVMWWKKRRRNGDNWEFTIQLDKDSLDRFNRLKARIPASDNANIIALALKCLEQKTDKIIKRQIRNRTRALKNEGDSAQQIAAHLEKEGYSRIGGKR